MGEGRRGERPRDGSGKPAKEATFSASFSRHASGGVWKRRTGIPLRPAGKEAGRHGIRVLNSDGSPLMPCTEAKARHLIERRKAKVVRRTPFIIRLTFLVEGEVNTESATLGVDAGSSVIGVSATTEGRVLFEAEVEIRQDVPQNMEERRSKRSGKAEPKDPLP